MTEEPRNWIERVGGWDRVVPIAVIALLCLAAGAVIGALAYRELRLSPSRVAADTKASDSKSAKEKGPGSRYAAQFSTGSLYPAFSPKRRYYVTRCTPSKVEVEVNALAGTKVRVAGYPPETGRFKAEARPLPGQDFEIEVTGSGGPADGTYEIRCLPVGFPVWRYQRFRKPPTGEFLVAVRPKPQEFNRAWIIAFDQEGTPRWWYSPEFNALWAQVLDDGTLQWARGFGDGFGQDTRGGMEVMELDGTPIAKYRTVNAPVDGHEFLKLGNGNLMIMSYKPRLGVDLSEWGVEKPAGVLTGEIQEVTPQGKVVWQWNSWDHIGPDQIPKLWRGIQLRNPHADSKGRDRFDYFHLNSIQPWRGQVVISTRHTNAVFGLSRKTGEVLWKLGGTKTPQSLKIIGPDPHRKDPLGGNHDARITDGNLLSVHDNGTWLGRPPRVVRYRIDPEAGTARFVSQVMDRKAAPESNCCGSARRFGSGWLVSWGDRDFVSAFDSRDRLAFRLRLPDPSYRAAPVPEGVPLAKFESAIESLEPDEPLGGPVRPIERLGK